MKETQDPRPRTQAPGTRHPAHVYTLSLLLVLILTGCAGFIRTEKDIHTVTDVDTVDVEQVHNQPNDRDNGIIYPSSRTLIRERHLVQHDSVEVREYPDFIRLGAFEAIGLIGSSISGGSTGNGLFGIFLDMNELIHDVEADSATSALFSGGIYRIGIGEWKMHWFSDDPNWTWGVTAFELIQPDDDPDNTLRGVGILSIRKRFYFRDKIPYFAITPQIHMSAFPSQYINAAVSADLGSIGGVNLRAYGGYAFGLTAPSGGKFINFPYAGLGVSMADFLNREEEMEVEWKYHEHSAWEIGLGEGILLGGNTDHSIFRSEDPNAGEPAMKGFNVRLLTATIALPILDHRFALGTSLAQYMVLGVEEYGLSFLPIRASYFWQPFSNATFTVEPFVEYNYAPAAIFHAGIRTALPISDQLSVIAVVGFASGNTGSTPVFTDFNGNDIVIDYDGNPTTVSNFNAIYVGFGASFLDRIFGKGDLRYGKGYPHE